jgi:phage-related protein
MRQTTCTKKALMTKRSTRMRGGDIGIQTEVASTTGRSLHAPGRRARRQRMVLLHGFVKKSRATPSADLDLARTNKRKHERGLS